MTIDKYKEHLLDIMDSMPDDACGDWRNSLAYAIETLNKYQQIEQIYSDYLKYMNSDNLADRIGEVLEDGNE